METIEIEILNRDSIGSSNAKRQRKLGKLPAVVYQPGKESLSLLVDRHSFVMSAKGKSHTQLFKFKGLDSLNGKLSLVKSVQKEPIKGEVIHVEFLAVSDDHKVVVSIPLKLEGTPECVKQGIAIINQTAYEIALECYPTQIPESLTLDISSIHAGGSLHASDVILPNNCSLKSPAGLTVVSAMVEKKVQEVAAPAAATPAAPAAASTQAATKK